MAIHTTAITNDTALIFEVKGNSLDDGPGIRTVIFFKGCPLDCVWCHNPESKSGGIELSFDRDACIMCDACRKVCTVNALDRDNPYYIDRDKCTLCMNCVEECPSGSLSPVGRYWTIKELTTEIEKDIPFFSTSGGGITLSGGEPTRCMNFIGRFLKEVASREINTLLETCGLFDLQHFLDSVYPWLNIIYFDIKLFDEDEHRRYCGTSNRSILENFTRLSTRCRKDGVELRPRIPLVPGITATDHNLRSIAHFLKGLGIHQVELLSYNPLWFDKCEKIGGKNTCEDTYALRQWMPAEQIEQCTAIFKDFDLR
jgi:pyruvate formate lyase activating enzyme